MRGHLGIRQGPVEDAIRLEFLVVHQCTQFVVRGVRVNPPRDQHRAGEHALPLAADAPKFGIQELLVERGIVGHQVMPFDETGEPGHDFRARGRFAQHRVGDAGVPLDEGIDAHAGVHQALEAVGNARAIQQDRADFDGPFALLRGQPGGFEVEHDDGVRAARVGFSAIAHGKCRRTSHNLLDKGIMPCCFAKS